MLWASLLLPSLALDTALRERPLPGQPFALVHGPARQRTLLAVDGAARRAGLYPGQRLAEAEAICRRLQTAGYDASRVRAALDLIAAWAYRYSSDVLLDPPRAVALEASRSLRLLGPWRQWEPRLRDELAGLGFHHRVALAPNPRAARVLAGARDGVVVMTDDALPHALAHVPVTRAGLPREAAGLLAGMGLDTLGKVLALPRAALQRRGGKALVDAMDVLLGRRPGNLAPYRPPDRFVAHVEFAGEVRHVHGLLFAVKRMLGDLAAFVAARDGGVARFVVRCRHADASPTDIRIGLLTAEREAQALFEVAKLHLDRLRLPAPVLELEVIADELPPLVPAGTDLFGSRRANALPWPQLVERLRARLGEEAVHGLRADADPRPERASVRDDASCGQVPGTAAQSRCGQALPMIRRLPRPTWLLPRPIPLRGPAPRVLAGPERLETGWWDGEDVRRDYYVLELSTGQRAWAFCAPGEHGPFMLHGWFA